MPDRTMAHRREPARMVGLDDLESVPADDEIHALVEAARAGDVEAQGEIFDRYHRAVHRYAWARLRSIPDAEDAMAETFVAAFQALPKFRWRGVPFEAWLFRIANSKVIDVTRRRGRTDVPIEAIAGDPADPAGDPVPRLELVERRAELAEALGRLPPAQHDVLVLRFLLGSSIHDVARDMGRSEGAVKQLQARALVRLRRELER